VARHLRPGKARGGSGRTADLLLAEPTPKQLDIPLRSDGSFPN
jgi:hypothetical protein